MRKIVNILIISFTTIFIAFIGYGCNNDDFYTEFDNDQLMKNYEYLDFDFPSDGILSDKECVVLTQAFQRIEEYLFIENDTCFITIHSANEINMSDRLFDLIEQAIENTNTQYKAYMFLKENNIETEIKNPFQNVNFSSPRLKYGGESSTVTNTWTTNSATCQTRLNHQDAITVLNGLRAANGSFSLFAAFVSTRLPNPISGSVLGLYSFLSNSRFSQMQNDYIRSGSTKGITLTEITVYSNVGFSTTMYNSSINY